ncbi:MAG: hypothetical protein ACPGLV_09940 [Bacteroidia bacterium]
MLKQSLRLKSILGFVRSVLSIVVACIILSAHTGGEDLLASLSVSFSGFHFDEKESITLNGDFQIIKKEGAYYGVSNLKNYCGTEKVGKWEKALDKSHISLINKFIKELNKTENTIYIPGFNNDSYSVDYAGKHWDIKPDNNIFNKTHGLEFSPTLKFYTTIFKDELGQLRIERKKHVEHVNELIFKKWFYNPKDFQSLKVGSELSFSANPNKNTTDYWEINDNNKLNAKSKTIKIDSIDISLQYHAEELVTDYMYLAVYENELINRIDDAERVLQNHSFYIKELTEHVLVLEIAY